MIAYIDVLHVCMELIVIGEYNGWLIIAQIEWVQLDKWWCEFSKILHP